MESLTPAEKMYKNHLTNVSNYQKRNPEKMSVKYKKRIEKLKQDPEAYNFFRMKRNESNKRFILKNTNCFSSLKQLICFDIIQRKIIRIYY